MPVPAAFKTLLTVYTPRGTYTVPYAECPGSPEVSSTPDRVMARRTFLVPWSRRWDFCQGMLGWSELATNNGGTYVARILPQPFRAVNLPLDLPPIPGIGPDAANLYAVTVEDMRGLGVPTDKNLVATTQTSTPGVMPTYNYTFARVIIGYELPHYQLLSDQQMANPAFAMTAAPGPYIDSFGNPDEAKLVRYVTRHSAPAILSGHLPGGGVKYVTDGEQAINKRPFTQQQQDVMLIWRQVPLIPSAIFTHVGCVNNAQFVDNSQAQQSNTRYSFPAGTLLLAGVQLETYRMIGGRYAHDITYRFNHFDPSGNGTYGHNYQIRFHNNAITYELITADGTLSGQTLYASADFNLLFRAV